MCGIVDDCGAEHFTFRHLGAASLDDTDVKLTECTCAFLLIMSVQLASGKASCTGRKCAAGLTSVKATKRKGALTNMALFSEANGRAGVSVQNCKTAVPIGIDACGQRL